jgi:hypothetical protein
VPDDVAKATELAFESVRLAFFPLCFPWQQTRTTINYPAKQTKSAKNNFGKAIFQTGIA